MSVWKCECGESEYYESGMPPQPCQGCSKCGTAFSSSSEEHKPLVPHDLVMKFSQNTGKPRYRMCRRCHNAFPSEKKMTTEHFDFDTPETGRPFIVGYRKFVLAVVWLALAIFVVLWSMLARPSSGQITLALWVVGTAGFFCAVFVGGNVLAKRFVEFWKVQTKAELRQEDRTERIIYQDSNEDAAWRDAEKEFPK